MHKSFFLWQQPKFIEKKRKARFYKRSKRYSKNIQNGINTAGCSLLRSDKYWKLTKYFFFIVNNIVEYLTFYFCNTFIYISTYHSRKYCRGSDHYQYYTNILYFSRPPVFDRYDIMIFDVYST